MKTYNAELEKQFYATFEVDEDLVIKKFPVCLVAKPAFQKLVKEYRGDFTKSLIVLIASTIYHYYSPFDSTRRIIDSFKPFTNEPHFFVPLDGSKGVRLIEYEKERHSTADFSIEVKDD